MSALPRSILCDRVRAQVSLRLDGELSQLESRMVDAHLARCADCREFETEVADMTARLRAAPFEMPSEPVVVSRPGRSWVSRAQVSMVAAVAVAVLGVASQLTDRRSEPALPHPVRYDTSTELTREVKQIVRDGEAFAQTSGSVTPI
jgi:anti-sigma factor RsiW